MANSNIKDVIDTIIKNWNNLFSKLSKKKEDGQVVTADDVRPAVLEAGEEIYENNLTPSVVADTGYKVEEFNEIYDKVTDTRIDASDEVPGIQEEIEVNPIQLAALKEADSQPEVQEIITSVKEDPNFIPHPPTDSQDDNTKTEPTETPQGFAEGEPAPEMTSESSQDREQQNETTGGDVPAGEAPEPAVNTDILPPSQTPGDVVQPSTQAPESSAGTQTPPQNQEPAPQSEVYQPAPQVGALSYTLHKNDGSTVVRSADDVGTLTNMIIADNSEGFVQLNNQATFNALQGAGLIPAGLTYEAALAGQVNQDGTPVAPAAPAAPGPIDGPATPSAPAAPAVSDVVRNELNKMFMQYTGRPADEADIALHGPKITSGEYSMDNFRFQIAAAPEAAAFREKTIKEFFRQYVGTEATPEDIAANSQIMANGETLDKTKERFLAAPPSQAFHNSMIITDSNGVTRDLYGFPPSDREAAKNHIEGGGTFAQLDNLGSIMNSGDPVAIQNWNNFVANGGALPNQGGTSGGSQGGSNPAPSPDPAPTPANEDPVRDAVPYRPDGKDGIEVRDAPPYRPDGKDGIEVRDAPPYRPDGKDGPSGDPVHDSVPYRPDGKDGIEAREDTSSQNRYTNGSQPPTDTAYPPLSNGPNPYLPPGAVPLAPTASYNQGPTSNDSALPSYTPPAGDYTSRYDYERGQN